MTLDFEPFSFLVPNSNSHIEILQRFQSKTLRIIANTPIYITNLHLHRDLKIALVKDEIKNMAKKYTERIHRHPKQLASSCSRLS